MTGDVVRLADYRQKQPIELETLAAELALDWEGLQIALVVRLVAREMEGEEPVSLKRDALAVIREVRTPAEIRAAVARIDARRRGPAGRGRAA